jgi:hypothetical protein
MSCPPHSSCFDHPNDIWWGVQIIKLLVMQSSPLPSYPVPPRPKYLFSAPYFRKASAYVSPSLWATKFHTHTKQVKL